MVFKSATIPAIANAIYNVGIRLRESPFTPERVLAALREKRGEKKLNLTEGVDPVQPAIFREHGGATWFKGKGPARHTGDPARATGDQLSPQRRGDAERHGKKQMAKILVPAFVLFLSGGVVAQTKNAQTTVEAKPFFQASGGFVAITVPDLDAAAKWYVEKLGLKIVKNRAMRPDNKAAVTILEGNGFAVELIWLAEAAPLAKVPPQTKGPQDVHGILKSGIFVDDLDAALKELRSRNVTFAFDTFYDKSMDCRMFAIRDNNGNILQFFGK